MNKLLPLLLLLSSVAWAAAPPASGTRETVGPMSVGLPAGWKREVRPDGTIAFVAGDGQGRGEVQFSSVEVPGADASTAHKAIWSQMQRELTAPNQQQSGQLGRFEWSEMEALDPSENRRFWFRLYTTKEANTLIVVLVAGASAPAFRDRITVMDEALGKAQFSGARPAATSAGNDVPVVESQIHVETRSISLTSNVLTDHVLFFQNGIAVRTGFINGPRECYALLPVANLSALPLNYGRWREDTATRAIDVVWQEGPVWRLARDGREWSLGGKKLLKFRPIDGAKFNGIFAYRPVGGEPTALKLTADGRFEALNLTDSMICQTGQPVGRNGNGKYEVRKWTLFLHFDDGATTLLPLKIPDEESLQNVTKFTVISYDFLPVR